MNTEILAWTTAIISVIGNILINYRSYYGMLLWIVSNAMWIYYGMFVQINHAQVFMYLTFTITNLQGIYKWKIQKK